MKYFFASVLPVLLLLSVFSCKPEDEIYSKDPNAQLQFSTDTVSFDTVFVAQGSVTRRLKVYNPGKNAVKIDEIKMGRLGGSEFSIIVDGEARPMISGLTLRGEDSLLILVKAYIDPNNSQKPFIIEDNLIVSMNGKEQKVVVYAYGQNANYFKDTYVCNVTWSPPKAYILYGDVVVPENCTLTIMPGTKVYAHPGATLYIEGTLKVLGSATQRVIIQNDRRDSLYAHIPGLWNGIIFTGKSKANEIQFAEIKNANIGLNIQVKTNPVIIKNSVIRNCFNLGILGVESAFEAENCLITNCGQYAIAGVGGGNYKLNFCTVANYTPLFKRDTESVTFSDSVLYSGNKLVINPTFLEIKNSIVWSGTRNNILEDEILFLTQAGTQNITITNSLLQSTKYRNDPKFLQAGQGNIFMTDPEFTKPGDGSVHPNKIKYTLKDTSPAIGKAAATGINIDLLNDPRPQGAPNPDMGAYESTK